MKVYLIAPQIEGKRATPQLVCESEAEVAVTLMEKAKPGQEYLIEVDEMSKDQFEALPAFKGWESAGGA